MGVRQIDDGRQGVVDDHGEAQSDAGGDHLLKESHGIGVEDIGRTADVIKDIQRQRGGGLVDDVGISQQCFERSGFWFLYIVGWSGFKDKGIDAEQTEQHH